MKGGDREGSYANSSARCKKAVTKNSSVAFRCKKSAGHDSK